MKLMLMGHGRSGKDVAAEQMKLMFDMSYVSSSRYACAVHVFPRLKELAGLRSDTPEYVTEEECYADRHNHRALWYDLIKEYNAGDGTRLGREIFRAIDVYVGVRSSREFHALRNTNSFDYAIWVDAFERTGYAEGRDSCTVEPWMADYVVDNNGSIEDLEQNISNLITNIR